MNPVKKASSAKDRVSIIGAGRMCGAIVSGLIKSGAAPQSIIASDVSAERLKQIAQEFKIKTVSDNQKAAEEGDTIILAVKPQAMADAVDKLKINGQKLIISIAAGITLEYLENKFEGHPVIRAMPNNPALIGEGITALAYGGKVSKKDIQTAQKIFKSVGDTVEVPENMMDVVTGLSGSGPAFVYLFVEGMVEAGEALGLTRQMAEKLALQTVLGSAKTLKKSGKKAHELREMVTSPGGTTIEGLRVLESKGFKAAITEAIKAAALRAKEISQEWTR